MADPLTFGPVPKLVRYVSLVALVGGVVMIFVGGWRIGVTWDEPYHVQRFNNYLDTGWYVIDGQRYGDEPGPEVTDQYVYGPATMLLLHGLGVVTGVEGSDAAGTTATAYAVRHLGIGLISLVGIAAVGATARLLFRRWDWGLVAAATFSVLPMWTGHSMFNLKDVPVATGYAVVTFGLALIARRERGQDWRVRALGPLAILAGTFLAVGTRPGMWTAMFASVAAVSVCWLLRPGDESVRVRLRADRWRYLNVVIGFVVAYVALWVIDPKIFGSPVNALVRSAVSSATFLGVEAPRSFVPMRVFLQVPSMMLALFVFGLILCVGRILKQRLRLGTFDTRMVLVLVQIFTLPVIAIVQRASLYGDLRQLMFAAPATVLVATFGMVRLLDLARAGRDQRGPAMVAVATSLAVAAPAVDQATLFPYNYTYYNLLTSVAQVPADGDYYRASARELVPRLPRQGPIICNAEADLDGRVMRVAHLDGYVDCVNPRSSPIAAYAEQRRGRQADLGSDEFWIISFDIRGKVPVNCDKVTGVGRETPWRRTHMATLSRCSYPFPTLSSQEIDVLSKRGDLELPNRGWFMPGIDGYETGARSMGGKSSLRFRLDRTLAGGDVTLVIRTRHRVDLVATIDGHPANAIVREAGSPSVEVQIPREIVDGAIASPITLVFDSPNDDPLEMSILGARAVPVS